MEKRDPDWKHLTHIVQTMIDSELKDRILLEAQKGGIDYANDDRKLPVENFSEIGKVGKWMELSKMSKR